MKHVHRCVQLAWLSGASTCTRLRANEIEMETTFEMDDGNDIHSRTKPNPCDIVTTMWNL
jgi:hypothetical protein